MDFSSAARQYLRSLRQGALLVLLSCFLATDAVAFKTVDDATNVAKGKHSLAHIYNASGANVDNNSFGGGPSMPDVFDGVYTEYIRLPKAGNNAYIVLDFTSELPGGYYVTQFKVGAKGVYPFSLFYWPAGGSDWTPVVTNCLEEGTQASPLTYDIGEIVTQVKVVFHTCRAWQYNDYQISELEVWGLNPADMYCTHPSYSEWEMKVPATCTTRQIDHRYCNECHEEAEQDVGSPLGHDYVTHLEKPGKCNRYGKGWIDCSRTNCDFRADFPEPVDMVTLGGFAELYKVQFTDVRVSSEYNPGWWGTWARHLFDNNWEGSHWAAMTRTGEWVDFEFGTTIDPTWAELSAPNHDHTIQFFARDGETETLLAEVPITKIVTYGDELDPETGEPVETSPAWQRVTVEFTEKHAKAVRVRFVDEIGFVSAQNNHCTALGELHLYGTVYGGGHLIDDPTTIMILR